MSDTEQSKLAIAAKKQLVLNANTPSSLYRELKEFYTVVEQEKTLNPAKKQKTIGETIIRLDKTRIESAVNIAKGGQSLSQQNEPDIAFLETALQSVMALGQANNDHHVQQLFLTALMEAKETKAKQKPITIATVQKANSSFLGGLFSKFLGGRDNYTRLEDEAGPGVEKTTKLTTRLSKKPTGP